MDIWGGVLADGEKAISTTNRNFVGRMGHPNKVDLLKGVVKNLTKDKIHKTTPFPRFIRDIVYAGGLKNYIKETGDL